MLILVHILLARLKTPHGKRADDVTMPLGLLRRSNPAR
jgi:hypothetical protein